MIGAHPVSLLLLLSVVQVAVYTMPSPASSNGLLQFASPPMDEQTLLKRRTDASKDANFSARSANRDSDNEIAHLAKRGPPVKPLSRPGFAARMMARLRKFFVTPKRMSKLRNEGRIQKLPKPKAGPGPMSKPGFSARMAARMRRFLVTPKRLNKLQYEGQPRWHPFARPRFGPQGPVKGMPAAGDKAARATSRGGGWFASNSRASRFFGGVRNTFARFGKALKSPFKSKAKPQAPVYPYTDRIGAGRPRYRPRLPATERMKPIPEEQSAWRKVLDMSPFKARPKYPPFRPISTFGAGRPPYGPSRHVP